MLCIDVVWVAGVTGFVLGVASLTLLSVLVALRERRRKVQMRHEAAQWWSGITEQIESQTKGLGLRTAPEEDETNVEA